MAGLIQMLNELESHRLEVVLVPLNPKLRGWNEYGMKRVCADVPPRWYRALCRDYPSSRGVRRGKPDTRIRRANVLRALTRMVEGRGYNGKYAQELIKIADSIKT
jgi:hypothetical protein